MYLRNRKVLNMGDSGNSDGVEQMETNQERGEIDDVAVQDVAGYIVVLRYSEVRVENDGDTNEGENGSHGAEVSNQDRVIEKEDTSNGKMDRLLEVMFSLKSQMEKSQSELKSQMERSQSQIEKSQSEVKSQIEQSQAEIKTDINTVNNRIDCLKSEVSEKINSMLTETNK